MRKIQFKKLVIIFVFAGLFACFALIDTATGQTVVTTIPVGGSPGYVAVDTARNRIYIGDSGANGPSCISVIDGFTNTVIANVQLAEYSTALLDLAVNPETNRIYGTTGCAKYPVWRDHLFAMDGDTLGITHIRYGLIAGNGVAVNLSTNRIYASSWTWGYILVIDGATNATVGYIQQAGDGRIAVNPTTNRIYALISATSVYGPKAYKNTASVIDGVTNSIIERIAVDDMPSDVAVNSITNRIYVSHANSNEVWVIDGATDAIVATIPVGPEGYTHRRIAVNPQTNKIYVINSADDIVYLIDGFTNSLIAAVPVGDAPADLDINPDTGYIYVANAKDGTVSVITELISATIDIHPDTLNLNSKGKFITSYIELPEGYYVEDIDIDSVTLTKMNDVLLDPPLYTVGSSRIGDYDEDGNTDLMMQFDRQELIPVLEVGDVVITVTGELLDGPMFQGTDTIRVIDRGGKK